MTADERDRIALRAMDSLVIRLAILVSTVVLIVAGPLLGEVRRWDLFVVALVVGLVLATVVAVRPWNRLRPDRDATADRLLGAWQTLSALLGFAVLPVYLAVVLDTSVQMFGPAFALFGVVAAYTLPARRRPWLLAWLLLMWVVALWFGGVRGAGLIVQAASIVTVMLMSVWVADARRTALTDEITSRSQAEQYANLLATVSRTNTLDADALIRAITDGLRPMGFDGAKVCEIRLDRTLSPPIAGSVPEDLDVSAHLELDPDEVLARGEVIALDPRANGRLRQVLPALGGALIAPIDLGERGRGVVLAVTAHTPPTSLQREAVEVLAAEAGRGLASANAYAADRRVVDELRQLDDRTHDFVTTVSHELRTPLTVVHGLGQTLRQRWDDLDVEQRVDLLDRVSSNVSRLENMVGSLLDSSALDRDELRVRPIALDLRAAVVGLLHRLATMVVSHAVVVDVREGTWIDADESLLEHVLENLVTNAVKYTPAGTEIRIRATRVDDSVEVEVSDDGPGINPADLPFVTDRFYRGGSSTHRASSGLGLGLAFTRQILDAHGTDLVVASDPGAGARFTFRLRAAEAPR
jgi:signal transduction histidine kinase